MYNPILFLRISSREFVLNRFKRRTLSHFLLQVSLRRSRGAFWRDSFHSNLYPNNITEYSSLKMWQDFFPFLSSPDRVPRANTLFRTNSLESISIFSVPRQNTPTAVKLIKHLRPRNHLSPYFFFLFPRFNVWKAANPLPSSELSPRMKNRGGGRQRPKDRGAVVEGWTIAGQYFAVKIIHRPGEGGRSGGARDTNLTDRLLRPTPQFPSADMSIILPRKVVLRPWRMEQGLMRAWAWKGGTVRFLNWTRIMAKVLQVNFLLASELLESRVVRCSN